jgi:hypothetical protein
MGKNEPLVQKTAEIGPDPPGECGMTKKKKGKK